MKRKTSKPIVIINFIVVIVFIISACCIDSESNVFFFTGMGSGLFLGIEAIIYGLVGGSYDVD